MGSWVRGVQLFNKVPILSRPCCYPGVLAKMCQLLSFRLLPDTLVGSSSPLYKGSPRPSPAESDACPALWLPHVHTALSREKGPASGDASCRGRGCYLASL